MIADTDEEENSFEKELNPKIVIESSLEGIEAAQFRANYLFWKGEVAEALRIYSKAIWILERKLTHAIPAQTCSNVYLRKAAVLLSRDELDLAEECCTKALKWNYNNMKAKFMRGEVRFKQAQRLTGDHRQPQLAAAMYDVDFVAKHSSEYDFDVSPEEIEDLKAAIYEQLRLPNRADEKHDMEEGAEHEDCSDVEMMIDSGLHLKITLTLSGIIRAKVEAMKFYHKRNYARANGILEKIVLLADTGLIKHLSDPICSVLHTDHAQVRIDMGLLKNAEDSLVLALKYDHTNLVARFHKARVCYLSGTYLIALQEVSRLLEAPNGESVKGARELQHHIARCIAKGKKVKQDSETSETGALPPDDEPPLIMEGLNSKKT